jgi:hypothetical protein
MLFMAVKLWSRESTSDGAADARPDLVSVSSVALTDASCVGMLLVGVGASYTLATCYPQLIMAGAFVTYFGFGLNGMAWVTSNKGWDYVANIPNIFALAFNSLLIWVAVESFPDNREFCKIDNNRWGDVGSPKVILFMAWGYHLVISSLCVHCWWYSRKSDAVTRLPPLAEQDILRSGSEQHQASHQNQDAPVRNDHADETATNLTGKGSRFAKHAEQIEELRTSRLVRLKYKYSVAFGGAVSVAVLGLAVTNAVNSEQWLGSSEDTLQFKHGFKTAPIVNIIEAALFTLQWLLLVAALRETWTAYAAGGSVDMTGLQRPAERGDLEMTGNAHSCEATATASGTSLPHSPQNAILHRTKTFPPKADGLPAY